MSGVYITERINTMAKNTVVATRKPTAQQTMLIKLASREKGVTRPEVREALGYEPGANIPVQTMLKNLATRFGFDMISEPYENDNGRQGVVYGFRKPVAAAALKTRRGSKKVAKSV